MEKDIIGTIIDYTKNAAFRDIRFEPVTQTEISQLGFSINYLKNPFKINKADLFENKFQQILRELKMKAGSNGEISFIELYECEEN